MTGRRRARITIREKGLEREGGTVRVPPEEVGREQRLGKPGVLLRRRFAQTREQRDRLFIGSDQYIDLFKGEDRYTVLARSHRPQPQPVGQG